ncbi:MAG TPA: family 10 glycosylhydrolase [Gemmatimonadaceae bacterium]|nr:family 10 glycosylhydrolase [Gemmatimonadaceae bacterium]
MPRLSRPAAAALAVLGALAASASTAAAQLPAEGRALWVNRFEYDSPERIAHIMERAAGAGFNIVYFQVRGAADAFYRSDLEPCAVLLCGHLGGTPPYDPLDMAVREAHRYGLQLHAWLNALTGLPAGSAAVCATLRTSDPGHPDHILLRHPEWVMLDRRGRQFPCPNSEEYVWLSPAYAGVRSQLAAVAADIVRRYAVDGIHLDRIRYPSADWSYDAASLALFGGQPEEHPAEWDAFRRALVNATVHETFDSVTAVRSGVVLSAAVWGVYDDRWRWHTEEGRDDLMQDPRVWAREGYLDVVVPMTYLRVKGAYCARADWVCAVDDHVTSVQETLGHDVYVGIDAGQGTRAVVREIRLARRHGARGVAIYSVGAIESARMWNAIAAAFREAPPATTRAAGASDAPR